MTQRLVLTITLLFSFIVIAGGCFSSGVPAGSVPAGLEIGDSYYLGKTDPKDPSRSLVYGYIDMKEAPSKLESVLIKQYLPKPQYLWGCIVLDESIFFSLDIQKGSYQVEKFGGSRLFKGRYLYRFGRGKNQTALRIKKPGMYFLGAYKFIPAKDDWKFTMKAIKSPSEKVILKRILKYLEKKGKKEFARQIRMIKQKIRKLG